MRWYFYLIPVVIVVALIASFFYLKENNNSSLIQSNYSTSNTYSSQQNNSNINNRSSQSTQQPPQQSRQLQTNRNSPEIPSEAELATLPDCQGKQFTEFPVDLSKVYEIVPLGNLAPPGHTLPTEHSYSHFNAGGSSNELFSLYAPGEVYITSISKGTGFTQDPYDYTIYFALCKDIISYYNHVKSISPELEAIKSKSSCKSNPGNTNYEYCEISLDKIIAGKEIGKVGGLQGNYDFGLMDFSKKNNYANPNRYGLRSLHIQCPYEYYPADKKQKFFTLITSRDDPGQCGSVMQDIPNTLQGNWFTANARADSGSDWDKYLSLVYDNKDPSQQVVSIGGVFTDPGTYKFTPQTTGTTNINFANVQPSQTIYCYQDTSKQGSSILIQLVSSTELKIEKQSQPCSSSSSFTNPTIYNR